MNREFISIKPWYFLGMGVTLKQNIQGDYFVSMPDDDWFDSMFQIGEAPQLPRALVENRPDIFQEILKDSI